MTQPRFPRLVGWFAPRAAPRAPDDAAPAPRWVDAGLLLALAATAYGVMRVAAEWRAPAGGHARHVRDRHRRKSVGLAPPLRARRVALPARV